MKQALDWPCDVGIQLHRHETARMIRQRMHWEQWEHPYKFAVIRNPFARLVSSYHFRQTIGRYNRVMSSASFEQWFEKTIINQEKEWVDNPLMYKPCHYWITLDGEVAVDDIYRLEEIENWWGELMSNLNYEAEIPHENATEHKPWQEHMTPDIEAEIRKRYADDLEYYPNL